MEHDEPDGMQADLVGDHPHAVGAHEGHSSFGGDAGDLALGFGAAFTGLGEPRRDGDSGRDTLAPALLEHGRYLMATHGQQSEVGSLGKLLDARVALESEEIAALWDSPGRSSRCNRRR